MFYPFLLSSEIFWFLQKAFHKHRYILHHVSVNKTPNKYEQNKYLRTWHRLHICTTEKKRLLAQ